MKAKRNDIQFIDTNFLWGVLQSPAERKFVQHTFVRVLAAAKDFLVDHTTEVPLEHEQIDTEDMFIDYEQGEISVTASVQLRCKFKIDGKELFVTEISFRD